MVLGTSKKKPTPGNHFPYTDILACCSLVRFLVEFDFLRQTDRQTDRHTHTHTHTLTLVYNQRG